MDGDNGRNLRKASKPLTEQARGAVRRFQGYPITLHVLERYGIENYFPRAACEQVLGRDLSGYFPIPGDVPIMKHFSEPQTWMQRIIRWLTGGRPQTFYRKAFNEQIAQRLQLADIDNTDLRAILDSIQRQVSEVDA